MTDKTPQSPSIVIVTKGESDRGDTSRARVSITSPTGIIAVVPYLLGFHPGQDMVVVGTKPPRYTVKITLRYSLDSAAVTDQVRQVLALLSRQHYDTAVAVGYGPDELVTPFMDWLRPEAEAQGIRFTDLLRVDTAAQRYWSYLCEKPGCCPPEGRSYDLAANAAVTDILSNGMPEVLASREALAATIASCSSEEATSMTKATRKAEQRRIRLLTQTSRPDKSGSYAVALAGIKAVKQAIQVYRQGDILTHDKTAWLSVALRDQWVRDDAWSRMDPEHRTAHLRLWTGVTRLALPGYVVAPASLLAFVAWQSGNGSLANIALDRAEVADPDYSMAHILRDALNAGLRPEYAELPMTPGEVAEWYGKYYQVDD